MNKNAKEVIQKGIERFTLYFDKESADGGMFVMIGKIGLAAEIGQITMEEMDEFITQIFQEHSKVKE